MNELLDIENTVYLQNRKIKGVIYSKYFTIPKNLREAIGINNTTKKAKIKLTKIDGEYVLILSKKGSGKK